MNKFILFREIFLRFWLVSAMLLIAAILFLSTTDSWSPPSPVDIAEVSICAGLDEAEGKPIEISQQFINGSETIYVCGYFDTRYPETLLIYWYRDTDTQPFFVNPHSEKYEEGYFSSKLDTKYPLEPGEYRVDIWHGREIISSVSFEVVADSSRP